jgi:hypothetical protein
MTVSVLLGLPTPNSVKFFAALELLDYAKDHVWLARVTNALIQHWHRKNGTKKNFLSNGFDKQASFS